MTDAALPVTQSAVEQFTEQYLTVLGCTVEKNGDTWTVGVPPSAETDVVSDSTTLYCGYDEEDAEDATLLHPESAFVQELLAEAGERAPVGQVTIPTSQTEIILPDWLTDSPVTVTETEFAPYYDRTALVVLFRVRLETVSEYQQELLRAVAVDAHSGEILPNLAETVLGVTTPGEAGIESISVGESIEPDQLEINERIDTARSHLMQDIRPTIDEIHRQASRAADRELEEYRRMQQQREQELEEEQSNLSKRIEQLSMQIDDASQEQRVQLLKQRKELRDEYDNLKSMLSDLRKRQRQGFPDQQREIRDRHALEVTVVPTTLTYVEYEQGDVEIHLEWDATTSCVTLGYGAGVGITETVNCKVCEQPLDDDRILVDWQSTPRCDQCSTSDS
jgi:hypothetical protein